MNKDKNFWKNKKVLITGHTGFKGSWLSMLLHEFGAKLFGFSLKPQKNFLFEKAKLEKIFLRSTYGNILDFKKLKNNLKITKPEIIFHLAAQPLVVESYKNPRETFDTNIIGTINLFEAARDIKSVKTIIIITTDKVYKIKKNNPHYTENHIIGASDPYGTSKSCVELISECYKYSFFKNSDISITSARAGNVIGGGDYSDNRIVPDYLNALNRKKKLVLRNPMNVRPWQYVLEPLYGYTLLAKQKYSSRKNTKFDSWNFAPNLKDSISVKKLIELLQKSKFNSRKVKVTEKKSQQKEKETDILRLRAAKAKKYLNWRIKFSLKKTIDTILNWNEQVKKDSYSNVCKRSIKEFLRHK